LSRNQRDHAHALAVSYFADIFYSVPKTN
jgi:hypothetical protein